MLGEAAIFFRCVADANLLLAVLMAENAAVYDEVAALVEDNPFGKIGIETDSLFYKLETQIRQTCCPFWTSHRVKKPLTDYSPLEVGLSGFCLAGIGCIACFVLVHC
jgi:hypothetical protein